VFGYASGGLATKNFFLSPLLFSLMGLGICAQLLKIQLCPPVCICFEFDPHAFCFYFTAS